MFRERTKPKSRNEGMKRGVGGKREYVKGWEGGWKLREGVGRVEGWKRGLEAGGWEGRMWEEESGKSGR